MKRPQPSAAQRSAGFGLIVDALRGFLLVALAVGYLLPAIHFSFVQHELCAEHGELRHSDARTNNPRSSATRASAVESAPAVTDEHDHCAVIATSSRPSALLAPPASAPLLAAEASPTSSPRAELAHISLELLHYAPKLAPPRC